MKFQVTNFLYNDFWVLGLEMAKPLEGHKTLKKKPKKTGNISCHNEELKFIFEYYTIG